jgi:predicted N-acetyltransferase YhbS
MIWQHIAKRPEFISTLATWFQDEWGSYTKNSVGARCKELEAKIDNGQLPLTMVATIENKLLGTYSLDLADLPNRPDLSPWLASVYVNPVFRNQGIGKKVVKESLMHAQSLQLETLYLYTSHHAKWYESMGWQFMEEAVYGQEPITIMKFSF